MIFILNFLSFESCNFFNLVQHLAKTCGNFNPYCLKQTSPMAGYTISYAYKEASKFFDDNVVYILIKENPETIMQHVLYGYYKQLYDNDIIIDFKNFFNIDFEKTMLNISDNVNNYYQAVTKNLENKKFITVDLTIHNNSFFNFLEDKNGLEKFVLNLNNFYRLTSETKDMATVLSDVLKYKNSSANYFQDYFIPSKWHAVPSWYNPTHYCRERDNTNLTYLEWFLQTLTDEIRYLPQQ